MLRRLGLLLAPKNANAAAFTTGGSTKLGSDEKFTQAAFEYIFEKNQPDANKRRSDVEEERAIALAHDRFLAAGEREFRVRMQAIVTRMSAVLESLPESLREEAVMLNSEQPPTNFRRATLTPPLTAYEPAFGLDVPQLRNRFDEYPHTKRSDAIVADSDPSYPFVDPQDIRGVANATFAELDAALGATRRAVPSTGVGSEAWEAEVALQRKALSRQALILDLADNDVFREKFDSDEVFRQSEFEKRGITPLEYEHFPFEEGRLPEPEAPLHYSQQPKMFERQ